MNKTVVTIFFQHIQNINLSSKGHLYIFPSIKIIVLSTSNFVNSIIIIREEIIFIIHQKVFKMGILISVSYLIIRINPIITIIIKFVSMSMTAYIYKILIWFCICVPVSFRSMCKNNSIFIIDTWQNLII